MGLGCGWDWVRGMVRYGGRRLRRRFNAEADVLGVNVRVGQMSCIGHGHGGIASGRGNIVGVVLLSTNESHTRGR